jgi:GT2 family glycosyltransferase
MNRFLFVVVLYRMSFTEAPTLRSLFDLRSLLREHGIRVLVVDNTPGITAESFSIDTETTYLSFGDNRGLASAYQAAYLMAKTEGYRHLVLLDQDSEVSQQLIFALTQITGEQTESVGIWCPRVTCYGKRVSPYSLGVFAWPHYDLTSGSDHLYGINSFSVVNVRFFEEIGGVEQFYWLDCLDTWLYEKAHRTGWAVRQLDVNVEHDLSLVSGRISLDRMKNIAFYESCFASEHWTPEKILGTALRLSGRGIKRMGAIGGARNYGSYLFHILKGMRTGMKRRTRRVS